MKKCERCGRLRSTKYLQQAVYIKSSLSEDLVVQSKANAYRCSAKSSCRKAAKNNNELDSEPSTEKIDPMVGMWLRNVIGYKIGDKLYSPEDVTIIRHTE